MTSQEERGNEDNLEDILLALRHEANSVREDAIQRLQYFIGYASRVNEKQSCTEAEAMKAWDTARTQILQQGNVVSALLATIDNPSTKVRSATALLLGHRAAGLEAHEAILRHLKDDPNSHVRMMCVAALGWMPHFETKLFGFIGALQDSDYRIAFPACIRLGELEDKRAVEPLKAVLSRTEWQVRFHACEALVRLHHVDSHIVALLEKLSKEPEAEKHNDMVLSVAELTTKDEVKTTDGNIQAPTTQAVLEQARRLLFS